MRMLIGAFLALLAFVMPAAAEKAPLSVDGATNVTVEQAAELFDEGVLFVDVRKGSDWEAGRIPASINLYVKDALTEEALAAEAGKDDKIVFYCNGAKCGLSSEACAKAIEWGYSQVYYMRDGFPGWEQAGMPIE